VPRHDDPLRNLAVTSVLAFLATALLVTSVVLWSARRSDQVTHDRQSQIVAIALTKSVEKIPYDQESVAIWDDSVTNVRNAFDVQWVDINLGVWMHTYFKHDRVYVLDREDRVLYTMADGKQAPTSGALADTTILGFVAALRARIAAGGLDDFESGKERIPRVVDLAFAEERPAIVAVMPLVSDTGNLVQERGTEGLIVSVRFLDSSFLPDLAESYLLQGVRFSRTNDIVADERSYPLTNKAGAIVGHFVWVPELPGSTILSEVLPVFGTGLVVVGIAITFLIRGLRRTYTDLIISEAQLKHLAFHDVLTGLPNRASFHDHLEKTLAAPPSSPGQIALLFLDLDRFKQVNDTLGHAAGDEVIRDLASRIGAILRPGDVLARMGGDEFAIIRRDARSPEEIEALCLEIISAVSKPFDVLGSQAVVGISIGVAMAPEAGVDRGELARKADIALYEAKKNGRQRFQFFTEDMRENLWERQALEVELRHALDTGNELEVVYQPVYSTKRLDVSGIEALVRWNHPRLGTVSPPVFVALAEECGLIDPLGNWVLRQACAAARGWDVETVAVNVSPIQFRQPDFAERVLAILSETGLAPSRLEVEITESTLLDSSGASTKVLKTLRDAGVRVALDDFGTGYSSLSYLMKLEVDRIKIDRSFVLPLGESSQSYSIVQAIVTMAHAVGVAVTAEGVETREQQEFLTLIGCNHLQGFLLSGPLPAEGLTELLAAGSSGPRPARSEAA